MNQAALAPVAQELAAHVMAVDVTQPDQVQTAMRDSAERLGAIHGLVHCAGILRTGLFERLTIEVHRKTVEVNLFGTLAVAHAALPYLRGTRGSLILMGSTSAFNGPPEFNSYGATKAAVLNLGQSLRVELAEAGVHVGVANPFFVDSPMLDAQNRQARLFRRFGVIHTPEQVAQSIVRGIARRQFLIWTGLQPRVVFWLSRYLSMLSHPISRLTWR
jgi:short-subunit dehydrogenase